MGSGRERGTRIGGLPNVPRITLKVVPQTAYLVVRRSPSTSLAILYPTVEWSSFWLYSTSIHKAISRMALPRVGYTI